MAETSLRYDLGRKACDHAGWGAPLYWVVALPHRSVVVHTDPLDKGYRSIVTVGEDGVLSPSERDETLAVADVLMLSRLPG